MERSIRADRDDREESDALREQWEQLIEGVKSDVAALPDDLLGDDGLSVVFETPSGEQVRAFPLVASTADERGLIHGTVLLVGIPEGADGDRQLYEYGPSRVSLNDQGAPLGNNPVALRALQLDRLTPAELELARTWLHPYST